MDNNSTMQSGSQGSRPQIRGSVDSPNDRTVTQSDSPKKEECSEIKDDEQALVTLKEVGFTNIDIKDLNLDII